MTENEKRILTLFNKYGSLTKPEICKRGRMGWATSVKLINRLLESGIIENTGAFKRSSGQGKNPEIFRFSDSTPLAVGVDVEYRLTRLVLTNLKGEILADSSSDTPDNTSVTELGKFLKEKISAFISRYVSERDRLAGIGIGLPGIGKESWIKHNRDYSTDLSLYLEECLETRVLTDINVRVYTVFEKWENRTFSGDDFMFITIRSGIGSGIFLSGNIYYGYQEHAGEIGHMTIEEDGEICVCGRRGCLQTEVNQNRLYRDYLIEVREQNIPTEEALPKDDLLAGLPDLFTRAKNGDAAAMEIVNRSAHCLAMGIANAVMVLNLPHFVISGHFGDDGDVLLKPLEEEIRKRILTRMDFNLSYFPLEDRGFTLGAALLILKDYFTDIPA